MLDIETGKLYKSVEEIYADVFDEKDEIVGRSVLIKPGMVLLALTEPHQRLYVTWLHTATSTSMTRWNYPKILKSWIWSCKFLAGDKVVELCNSSVVSVEGWLSNYAPKIQPLEKSDA